LDYLLASGLILLTSVAFWPALRWLATQTFAHEQLKQSFLVVVLAGAWIAWEKRSSLRRKPQLTNGVLLWLCAAYALAAGSVLLKQPLLVLAGLLAATGGFVSYLFGSRALSRTLPLLAVFAILILLVLLFPILDWPLRQMAGIESARLLKMAGLASQLAVQPGPPVTLLLFANGVPFQVATECNGFGLISSSFLLSTILLLYQKAPLWRHALTVPLCVAVAFVFNLLRITLIVMLAPYFSGHYHAMHETLGIIALYSGLGVVWFVSKPKPTVTQPRNNT
jgi:exosortase/archaeosortase family protein